MFMRERLIPSLSVFIELMLCTIYGPFMQTCENKFGKKSLDVIIVKLFYKTNFRSFSFLFHALIESKYFCFAGLLLL